MRTLPLQGSSLLPASRPASRNSTRKRLIAGCAVVGLATAFVGPAVKRRCKATRRGDSRSKTPGNSRRFLPPFLVDAFVGAMGEIGQLSVLYPLDTIKVRCQAKGLSTAAVWAGVRSEGFTMANLKSLFAGCAPSAICCAFIGSCYLASFCTAKRVFAKARLPGRSGECASVEPAKNSKQSEGTPATDTAAAVVASLLTSVLEAPVELFRHRMQAGLSHGKMLSNMAHALGGEGLGSLYWGYAPFLLKGIPYDVAELFSYSQLTKHQQGIPVLSALPTAFGDCCIGALAGGAAVVFSMPADCIKTRMELAATRPPPGLIPGSLAFFRTGRQMLAQGGIRCMFTGMTPRLLENVPSTMFYWVLVATLRRALEPFTLQDSGELAAA